MTDRIRILGLDPSLRKCGWGVIDVDGNRAMHVGHGVISPSVRAEMPDRLNDLFDGIEKIITDFEPNEVSVEDIFLNKNPSSTARLGYARAVCLLVPKRNGLSVHEYSAKKVKKSVVGTGQADKVQVAAMVNLLLSGAGLADGDAADALATAVCHAHYRTHTGPGIRSRA